MKKRLNLIICFLCVLFIFSTTAYALPLKKNIIIFCSYHRGYDWNDNIEQGIISTLKGHYEDANIKIEYLDVLNNTTGDYYDNLIDIYKSKYKNSKFDIVLCTDNAAYDFFLEHRNELFPDIPLVFTGLNNFESYESGGKLIKNSTGVLDNINVKDNVELILSMYPSTKNIFILLDKSIIGNDLSIDVNKLISENNYNVNLKIIDNMTLENTIEMLNRNAKNSVVLYASTSMKTNDGTIMYPIEIVHNLKSKTTVPIYGVWDILLNQGIIGGKVTSSFDQGVYCGNLAVRILNGEKIENIPILKDTGINYAFDYKELTKLKFNLSSIPKGSKIINEPNSVYSISKTNWNMLLYSLFFIFTLIIILLIISIHKKIIIEKKLKESELKFQHNFNFLRTLLDTINTPIFCKDINGIYTDCNPCFEKYIGLKRKDIINKTVYDISECELAHIYHKADLDLMNSKGTQIYETQVISVDKTKHDVEFNKSVLLFNDEPIGIVGIILDITERKKNEDKLNRLSKFKEAMINVNQAIIRTTDINELFTLILQKSIDSMNGANYGSVLLLNENNILKIGASIGYDPEKIGKFTLPLEESFHYIRVNGKIDETVIIDDIDENVDFAKEEWHIKSSISTPIIINNKLFGLLNIDSNKKDTFNKDDIYIMNYMKHQIENAIRTLNLYNEILYLSKYDKLTNIYNRRSFEDIFDKVLTDSLKNNTSFLLVVFDLNELKLVNDIYGHLQGDEYLKTFVSKLKDTIDDSDILARYGGDEFIGVFSSTDPSLLEKFEALNKYFSNNPVILEGNKITYSFSYGIASFPSEATTYSQLIKIADERMYKYKENFKK